MERKSFPFELEEKGLDPEARTVKGYAAIMGNVDEGGDVIDRGACKKTLAEQGDRIKVFYIHDFKEPIGRPLALEEVPRRRLPNKLRQKYPDATGGLYTHFYISETRRGNDAIILARDSVLDQLSIGYKTIKEDWEEKDGSQIRHLKEIKLMDVSLVPLGMNPAAIITDVKETEMEDDSSTPAAGERGNLAARLTPSSSARKPGARCKSRRTATRRGVGRRPRPGR
ncbi:MAG: HK97 family phage prohead protease, partial [Anaerolineales bacterium]|nr:HK97 family phage prohead protease [Armatimonadota bacterium]NIO98463.1 HK97 family phage prohead protease [Armatimonadota bacterium]NIS82772.1 HK97 family phage prohead protease [Anaerolineales bacterium]